MSKAYRTNIRFPDDMAELLREASLFEDKTINALVIEGVEKRLEEYKANRKQLFKDRLEAIEKEETDV